MTGWTFLIIVALLVAGFVAGRGKAKAALRHAGGRSLHSRPVYHGAYVAVWTGVPALVFLLLWQLFQGAAMDRLILASMSPHVTEGLDGARRSLLVAEIQQVAAGRIFQQPSPEVAEAAERFARWQSIAAWAKLVVITATGLLGFAFAYLRLSPAFRARYGVEWAMTGFMVFCSLVALITTGGIVLSLVYEALQFFAKVPVWQFLFGLNWEPQIPLREDQVAGAGAFGAVPVFFGTIMIATLAMLVAVPIGLLSAVYLTEYANDRARSVLKPMLEILAGIPTVVYGFFAVLIVAPAVRELGQSLGFDVSPNSALAAGGVMGIMIIPFISSLSDDAITAVPRAMRDGSLALGATKAETITRVLLPSALPGIMGGILLGLSRAIGETMIVVMAAGLIATLTANPLDGVTTVTVQIVTLLIGDTEFDNPKTLAAFALGLVLFLSTLLINIAALRIVEKYREAYE
jgi:phosphate transport system permease protein